MQACLNPATVRQGIALDDFLDAASSAGFAAVELRWPWVRDAIAERGLDGLVRRLHALGLQVAGIGYGVPLRAPDADFRQSLVDVPAICEAMSALGAPGGSVVLPIRQGDGFEVTRQETVDRLGHLARLTLPYDRVIFLEFIGLHFPDDFTWTKTVRDTVALMADIGQPNVGLLIDSYHWHLGGTDLDELALIPQGAPILLHINDAPPSDVRTLTDAMRVLPGEGVLDLPAWLSAIHAATGYDGPVSIELFNDELRAMEPPDAARTAYSALASVLRQIEHP